MLTRLFPLSFVVLSACSGISAIGDMGSSALGALGVGGDGGGGGGTASTAAADERPSPLLSARHCVDAMAAETGRNSRQIVVLRTAAETKGITTLQLAGADTEWTCETGADGDVVRLVGPTTVA